MAWKKGQSGNPGGRPKTSHEARLACQALNDETLSVLAELLTNADASIRFKAACRIRDEANGRPVQAIELQRKDELELTNKSEAELMAIVQGAVTEQASRKGGAD